MALLEKIKNTHTAHPEDITGLAHELWALAQLMPEEGILDGVMRIEEALQGKLKGAKDPLMEKMAEALGNLLFECDGITSTCAPKRKTYNDAFTVLQKYRESIVMGEDALDFGCFSHEQKPAG